MKLLSEDEFYKIISKSYLDKFRSAQFRKGMYAGYLETLGILNDSIILTETQLETLKQEYYGIGVKYGQENK